MNQPTQSEAIETMRHALLRVSIMPRTEQGLCLSAAIAKEALAATATIAEEPAQPDKSHAGFLDGWGQREVFEKRMHGSVSLSFDANNYYYLDDRAHWAQIGWERCFMWAREQIELGQNVDELIALLKEDISSADAQKVRDDFLLNGRRFKMNFNNAGNVTCFGGTHKELQGRWVALVAAEDDCHIKSSPPAPASEQANSSKDAEDGKKVMVTNMLSLLGKIASSDSRQSRCANADMLAHDIRNLSAMSAQGGQG